MSPQHQRNADIPRGYIHFSDFDLILSLSPSSFAKRFHIENEVSGGDKAPCLTIRRVIEILASTTDTVFVNSTNISTNLETARLSTSFNVLFPGWTITGRLQQRRLGRKRQD